MESNEIESESKLSNRQLLALPHIIASPTYEEAALRAEISSKQIYEWLKEPEFREELTRQRKEIFQSSLAFLKISTQKAAQLLFALLDHEDPRIRLLASAKILTISFKAAEIYDIEEKLRELEKLCKKKKTTS